MGYEALFFARMHYQEHDFRKRYKELEFIWQPDKEPATPNIFTHVLYDHYSAPKDFDFVSQIGKERHNVIVGNKKSKLYNADR